MHLPLLLFYIGQSLENGFDIKSADASVCAQSYKIR